MDQEAKYWRDKWKDEVKVNMQLRQDLLSMQDAQRAVKADRETVKRLKGGKRRSNHLKNNRSGLDHPLGAQTATGKTQRWGWLPGFSHDSWGQPFLLGTKETTMNKLMAWVLGATKVGKVIERIRAFLWGKRPTSRGWRQRCPRFSPSSPSSPTKAAPTCSLGRNSRAYGGHRHDHGSRGDHEGRGQIDFATTWRLAATATTKHERHTSATT
jgi:hypothetical protein